MPDIPRSYDPRNEGNRAKLSAARAVRKKPPEPTDAPIDVQSRPVFGVQTKPPTDTVPLPPICADRCRLGNCPGACRLTARTDKEEPQWNTPTKTS